MPWSISLGVLACAALLAQPLLAQKSGPVEFGLAEFDAAVAARHLRWKAKIELSLDPPETYRIEPYARGGARITGGDLRGLMYGLLEAAGQIRSTGRLAATHGIPAVPMRGIRIFLQRRDLDKSWYSSQEFWRAYFEMLARDRFNRFTLIFLADSLAPPYPFFLNVEEFPQVRVAGLRPDQQDRNLRELRLISQTAAEHAIDFTLGIWQHDLKSGAESAVTGLTPANIGTYSHDALSQLLALCPMIRSVQIQADFKTGVLQNRQAALYRDYIFKALREAGRRVTLDLRGSLREIQMVRAAQQDGVALHSSYAAWPRGFEIDPPPQPGNGEAPGPWEPGRHSLFYWLWGRLGYDPQTKPPKGENPEEYRAANRIINLLSDDDPPPGDWGNVATIPEAVRNRLDGVASAKLTPLETADLLLTAARALDQAPQPDFRLLAQLARYRAHKQRADYDIELFDQTKNSTALDRAEAELNDALATWDTVETSMGESVPADLPEVRLGLERVGLRREDRDSSVRPRIPALTKPLPRPRFTHMPVKVWQPEHPLTLTLQITPTKDVRAVRLHYRTQSPAAPFKSIEKPAGAVVTFTIPAADVPSNVDLLYYFEILNHENSGWFEPDPLVAAPYHVVQIEAGR